LEDLYQIRGVSRGGRAEQKRKRCRLKYAHHDHPLENEAFWLHGVPQRRDAGLE
jgi:hypothetical protein